MMMEGMDVWGFGLGSVVSGIGQRMIGIPLEQKPKAQDLRPKTVLSNHLFIKVDVLWDHNIGPISRYG
jgi:hypothetical protein